MAIAPIVGRLRKGLIKDLSISLGIGAVAGCYFWYGYHTPSIRHRDAYYAQLEKDRTKNSQ